MHKDSFVLKVGDLLRNPGKIDYLETNEMHSEKIPGLTSAGIKLSCSLQGVDDGSVKLTIKKLSVTIEETCDLSSEKYLREVVIEDKFTFYDSSVGTQLDDKVYDDAFPFANEHEAIDIEDFLVQCVVLERPLVCIKPGKEYLLDQFESDEEDTY